MTINDEQTEIVLATEGAKPVAALSGDCQLRVSPEVEVAALRIQLSDANSRIAELHGWCTSKEGIAKRAVARAEAAESTRGNMVITDNKQTLVNALARIAELEALLIAQDKDALQWQARVRELESAKNELAVVAPEFNESEAASAFCAIIPSEENGQFPSSRDIVKCGWNLAISKIKAIPSDQALGDESLIEERDRWEDLATELAEKVGDTFGVDVGEHSSSNCPVRFALELLDEKRVADRVLGEGEEKIAENEIGILRELERILRVRRIQWDTMSTEEKQASPQHLGWLADRSLRELDVLRSQAKQVER